MLWWGYISFLSRLQNSFGIKKSVWNRTGIAMESHRLNLEGKRMTNWYFHFCFNAIPFRFQRDFAIPNPSQLSCVFLCAHVQVVSSWIIQSRTTKKSDIFRIGFSIKIEWIRDGQTCPGNHCTKCATHAFCTWLITRFIFIYKTNVKYQMISRM